MSTRFTENLRRRSWHISWFIACVVDWPCQLLFTPGSYALRKIMKKEKYIFLCQMSWRESCMSHTAFPARVPVRGWPSALHPKTLFTLIGVQMSTETTASAARMFFKYGVSKVFLEGKLFLTNRRLLRKFFISFFIFLILRKCSSSPRNLRGCWPSQILQK